MATANCEYLAKVLKPGDFNVRVTVVPKNCPSTIEWLRDSVGGNILDSEKRVFLTFVNPKGIVTCISMAGKIEEILRQCEYKFQKSAICRLDIKEKQKAKTWIVVK